jgi:hypothetical protein
MDLPIRCLLATTRERCRALGIYFADPVALGARTMAVGFFLERRTS